jgi:glutamate racemase
MSISEAARKPVLFFDSGVGGLSVLAATRAILPHARYVYAADSAGFPYGTKSEAEIGARVPALLGRLVERYAPQVVVIACNTAATIALRGVRMVLDVPVVGTVPAIKPAALISKTRTIGVLGTLATVRQPYVDDLVRDFASDCHVLRLGTPELVHFAEDKLRGRDHPSAEYRDVLDRLFDQPGGEALDTIVLACTHFPLLRAELAAAAPRPIQWVDSGAGIARRVQHWTQNVEWPDAPQSGTAVFTKRSTDDALLVPALKNYGLSELVYL